MIRLVCASRIPVRPETRPLDLGGPQGILHACVRADGDTRGRERFTYRTNETIGSVFNEKADPRRRGTDRPP